MRLLASFPGDDPRREMHPLVTAIFGATAGAASVFGNTPLDVVKTRMQVWHYRIIEFLFIFIKMSLFSLLLHYYVTFSVVGSGSPSL